MTAEDNGNTGNDGTTANDANDANDGDNRPAVYTDEQGRAIYRASALGMCRTALITIRSGFEPMAPPDSMQRRFDEGHLHETNMVQRLNTEYGIEVFNREREVEWWITPTVCVRAHIDGEGVGWLPDEPDRDFGNPHDPPHRGIENKTMSSLAYKDWLNLDWAGRWKKYPGYAMQLTAAYGQGAGFDEVIYAVKDKESGQMHVEVAQAQPYPPALIKAKVLGIEAHVRQGLPLPEECDVRRWPCPVFYIGPCGDDKRDTLDERRDEIVQALATTYQEQKQVEAQAKKAKETARDEIKRHLGDAGKYDTAAGWKIAYREGKTTTKQVLDVERLQAEKPDLFEEYLVDATTTTAGALTVTPPKSSSKEKKS